MIKDFVESMVEVEKLKGITFSADGEIAKGGGGHVIKGLIELLSVDKKFGILRLFLCWREEERRNVRT
jgi:hypothetical protein